MIRTNSGTPRATSTYNVAKFRKNAFLEMRARPVGRPSSDASKNEKNVIRKVVMIPWVR